MKKVVFLLLLIILLISVNTSFALASSVLKKETNNLLNNDCGEKECVILNEYIFLVDSNDFINFKNININTSILPFFYIDPGRGTVRISDVLKEPSGITTTIENRRFTNFNTFRYASITIIENVPGLGKYAKLGI